MKDCMEAQGEREQERGGGVEGRKKDPQGGRERERQADRKREGGGEQGL